MALNLLQALGALSPEDGSANPYAPLQPAAPPIDVGAVQNILSGLNQGGAPNVQSPAMQAAPAPVSDPAPRQRRSILDTVGRLADVFAKVGGADALYQPTLDAREDRTLALGDHAQQVDLNKLKLETEQGALGDANAARIQQAAYGTQAILKGNPQADPAKVWALMAQQQGVAPDHIAALAQQITQDPSVLGGLSADQKLDAGTKMATSQVQTYNMLKEINPTLAEQYAAGISDPTKIVNAGGSQIALGANSGTAKKIIPVTEAPDTAARITSAEKIAAGNNATTIQVAGMPARGKAPGAAADGGKNSITGATMLLDNIQNGFNDLHHLNALPGDNGGAISGVLSAIGRTGVGQAIGEQAGSAAAQRRLLMEKDINSLQSEMVKSLPASATRTKFEQEIQRRRLPDPARMDYSTGMAAISDLRRSFAQAQQDAAVELAHKPASGAPKAGVVESGFRFTGGDPANKKNWVKVQ